MANKNNQTKKSNEELVSVFIPKQGRNDTERSGRFTGNFPVLHIQTGEKNHQTIEKRDCKI